MALSAPSIQQKRFAGIIAWERGKKIDVYPETSSALSGLISALQQLPALPVTEQQVDLIRTRLAECVTAVPGFDPTPFSELPEDRAEANRMLNTLRQVLNPRDKTRAEFVQARDSFEAYVSDATQAAGAARADVTESVVTDEEVPF